MTTSKHTKRAFLSSLLALLLCFSMLVGTTFAWFKDGVVSGKNQIVAGNLDVTLQHAAMENGEFETLEDVTSETIDLFTKSTTSAYNLWEPGAMAIEKFVVSNAGTVALQYSLDLNQLVSGDYNTVSWTGVTGSFDLTGVLKVAVTTTEITSREQAEALFASSSTSTKDISTLKSDKTNLQSEVLLPASEATTLYVVLYWAPATVDWSTDIRSTDNYYNLKNTGWELSDSGTKLFINASITLLATQAQYEYDSFGYDYDADAVPAVMGDDVESITPESTSTTTTEG